MTNIFVLLLMMALVAHDPSKVVREPLLGGAWVPLAVLLPYVLLAAAEWLACRWSILELRAEPADKHPILRRLDWFLAASRVVTLAIFVGDLYALGWLVWLRGIMGDTILLDEMLAVAPPLAVAILGWCSYYPIDRRLREDARDNSLAPELTWPIGTRRHYVLAQLRHQVLLILVPMAAVLAWMEAVELWIGAEGARRAYESAVVFGGFLVIFAFAPVMIRYVWDTVPLPDTVLRDRLMEMCRSYGVGVRKLLLWRTYGGMINGAVMGVAGPLRFILLTDGLLARMTYPEIEAVMAHEIGHVYRRHMVWLIVCAVAAIHGLETLTYETLAGVERLIPWDLHDLGSWTDAAVGAAVLLVVVPTWLAIFGWVSRRFERQADTFAVQHLTRTYPDDSVLPGRIGGIAVHIYCEALRRVAAMNHCSPDRKSWRHGSIQWRCDNLRTLINTPIDRCPIDRTVRYICVVSAVALAGLLIYGLWE